MTVVGFCFPVGMRVFCQTGVRDWGDVEETVQAKTDEHVDLTMHTSEAKLFRAFSSYVRDRLQGANVLLTAYNGETWNGGFDLPFLRTRFASCGLTWPFVDVPYADLYPVIDDLFNTQVDGQDHADLETAYAVLCDGEANELDPFEESGEAVEAFDDAEFTSLVLHNVADILRTAALGRIAERYCAKSDFQVKSLSPIRTP
ncbi:hypothetical protein [Haloarcula pelagica]|uniref:hypothetical protein n=1 Tax=Halomicroarcula sp. GCM10025709 TaxID=3252669 RepID=UPI0036D2670B